jgi:cytochrome c oxidase subunit 2
MFSHSVFNPASPMADAISNLFIFLMVASALVTAGLVLTLGYTLPRFRHRPGQGDPPQTFGRLDMEIVWTVLPTLLMVVVFATTVYTMRLSEPGGDPARSKGPTSTLQVIGHQWWWEFRYPSGVVTANVAYIPLHTRLLVAMKSVDVIHDLWVPQLAGKIDNTPGQTNYTWWEADRPGVYESSCVEYCGDGHAWMRAQIIAVPQAQFAAWERQQLQPARTPTTPLQQQGERLFSTLACLNCHTEQDIGPNLTHFASRPFLAGEALSNTPANVAKWLHDPSLYKPGVHMPNLNLTNAEVNALTAYLESLK